MFKQEYVRQVQLLLQCLPIISQQSIFAIKGGTAINLFILDLPRLSVDIDLTYLPMANRDDALIDIQEGLRSIASGIKKDNPKFKIKEQINRQTNTVCKLFFFDKDTLIKIEPNFIMRNTLHPIEKASLTQNASNLFKMFVDDIPLLATEELYAGKICAALNRQHPRDLFDIKLLFENQGITNRLRQAFVIYLACNPRPIHELLSPNYIDIQQAYLNEFVQMTEENISLDVLLSARERLVKEINNSMTDNEKDFLLSVKRGKPDFSLLPFDNLDQLPGLRWKIKNVQAMHPEKHKDMLGKLEKVLAS